ncbi:hypothetical protein BDV93DRAFT_511088 [Ceratobasidium sp. AG-I]|nr:hypothetical protein BDV93DRAFT_511088 [Ceratobasidium sp. AG-I]
MPSQGPDPVLTPRRTPRNTVPVKRGGETVVAQPNSKKSKTKSTALNVPTKTQDFGTEPSAETLPPAKKTRKSRKKVVDTPKENATVFEAAATSPPAPAPASALAQPTVVIIPTTPQAGEKAASGQADGATKKGTRKKNNSDIAQKVLEQVVEKQREKDAKIQRQIAKGKKKVVEETPAATQAFVKHARLNNDGGDAVTPNVLVRTEGSSHNSRIAYADARATSLQPSRAGSPAPSFVQDDDNEPLDLDMMEILKDIPSELAPHITPPPALPAPFRDIRRRVPLPDPDPNMSTRERTEYKKKAKLTHRKIDDHNQTIASTALSRFESLISTCNPFPTEEQTH